MGKQQKLKPDVILGNYWRDNARFADLFNAVIYDGEQVICPEELEDLDTEESNIMEHREYVHYAMPMRVMGYDYGAYKKQYDSNARKYKTEKGLEKDEFLSRMKKTDKFMPVITAVIYYGENSWDGAKTLHEMLKLPKGLEKFVNDYKMILIEAGKHKLKLHNVNNTDLFNLFEILRDKGSSTKENKQKAIEYTKEHEVDREVIMTVVGAVNSRMDYNVLQRKDGATMWKVFEAERMEGRIEGRIESTIKLLKRYNESETTIVNELMSEFRVPKDIAEEYLERFNKGQL